MLLGPRQAGKSTLVTQLKPDLTINLADELEFLTYSSRPQELAEQLVYTQILHCAEAPELKVRISSFRMRKRVEVDFRKRKTAG